MRQLAYAAVVCVMARAAGAAPLPETLDRLMALMPGTYDSAAQVAAEAARGVAEADRHERRHVIYARIAAPQVGEHVLYRQERRGGPEGEVVARSLAVFAPDPAAGGVRMWLRSIVDAPRFTDLHLKKELWSQVRFDPAYGGKCPFHWRAENGALRGTLAGDGCRIVANAGQAMAFEAAWTLTAEGLTIFDNTTDGEGKLLSGRADRVPTVYTRLAP
jgi:hypothetical protein